MQGVGKLASRTLCSQFIGVFWREEPETNEPSNALLSE